MSDYGSIAAINQEFYCSITGFGQTGLFAQIRYDFLIQGMGGLIHYRPADGSPGSAPMLGCCM